LVYLGYNRGVALRRLTLLVLLQKIKHALLGVAFGFPFIDFELKSEGVFYNTKCSNGTGDVWQPGKPLCTTAITLYNTLFTVAVVSCTIGVFLVGFIMNKIGMFWTRMIYCTITSLGKIFFKSKILILNQAI